MEISKKTNMWVLVILSLISLASVTAQSPVVSPVATPEIAAAPGPGGSDCMTLLFNMTDCLDFVTQGSNATKPNKSCCPELAGMLDNNPICLCQLFAKGKDYGIQIDMKRALKLPSFCKLQTPDISLCSEIGIPVGAPGALAGAPAGALAGSPAGAPPSGVVPMSSEGPSTSSPTGVSPVAEEGAGGGGKNGALSNAQFNVVAYLVASLAMAFIITLL